MGIEEYGEVYDRLRSSVNTRLKEGPLSADEVKRLEKLVADLQENKEQVETSLKYDGLAAPTKELWQKRVREWALDIRRLKGELENAKGASCRQSLALEVSGARVSRGVSSGSARNSERIKVSDATGKMEDDLRRIDGARKQLENTGDIGLSVLTELHSQRETILRSRDNMGHVSVELNSARQTLDRLLLRAIRNRMLTYAIACFFGTGLLVYELSYFGMDLEVTIGIALLCVLSCASLYVIQRRKDHRERLDGQALTSAG